ncbi:TIGR03089 family protein [Dactylosporangium fulvum]|uniref:TIGR03089 family protein n=1 Tax=Dactylosporangium fulvum TaxID=53359 RepID=A0ABY5W5D3_9ACTN|nr:TIGR03089 family protein [Dactylosporangium fulvum]UWP84469.1 TIGR03089 family protein [Dactylosporangium fulvum]
MVWLPAPHGTAAPAVVEPPLLTYYDDRTGERTELSATDLGGWAARAAGLLHESCGLGAGSRAAVLLPPHWLTAAALLGAWSIGVEVSFQLWATAGLPPVGLGAGGPFDVSFVAQERVGSWLEEIPEATHRFVLGEAEGYRSLEPALLEHSSSLPPYARVRRTDAASVDGTTYGEWGSLAQALASEIGLRPGDRLLIDAAEHEHPVKWLLAPLSTGATVVLCANLDRSLLDGRVAEESVTRVL